MNQKYLLFDLDGTLTDSEEGIAKSVAFALEHMGIHETDQENLRRFIGPPLMDSFTGYYGMTEEEAVAAIRKFDERYNDVGLFENRVYEGIPQLLADLKAAGKKLILATSKPLPLARRIMDRFELTQYFDDLQGPAGHGNLDRKQDVVAKALEENGITDLSEAIMIGDRLHDVLGARACGLDCVGVLYGFGDRSEMEKYEAAYIAETVEEVRKLFGV
ncbi:MAG: HAD hydrolase-like protein [Eubacteriales bacterium]|nr:HAD hydrolase-like protein [Eubacteriales bacterium]